MVLSHAGLSDEHGIVLGLARQNPDDIPYLVVTPDDGIELLLPRALHQVRAVFAESVVHILGLVAGHSVGLDFLEFGDELVLGQSDSAENALHRLGCVVEYGEHKVFDGHIFVFHPRRQFLRLGENLVGDGRNVNLVGLSAAAAYCRHFADFAVNLREKVVCVNPRPAEQHGHESPVLVDESVQQMLRHNLHILVFYCYILRCVHRFERFFGEFLCVHGATSVIL